MQGVGEPGWLCRVHSEERSGVAVQGRDLADPIEELAGPVMPEPVGQLSLAD